MRVFESLRPMIRFSTMFLSIPWNWHLQIQPSVWGNQQRGVCVKWKTENGKCFKWTWNVYEKTSVCVHRCLNCSPCLCLSLWWQEWSVCLVTLWWCWCLWSSESCVLPRMRSLSIWLSLTLAWPVLVTPCRQPQTCTGAGSLVTQAARCV